MEPGVLSKASEDANNAEDAVDAAAAATTPLPPAYCLCPMVDPVQI